MVRFDSRSCIYPYIASKASGTFVLFHLGATNENVTFNLENCIDFEGAM